MLHFPKITYLDERTLDSGRKIKVYELDWTGLRQLPEPYNSEVDGLLFGIDDGYLAEIKRNQERAIEEWDFKRPFDTIIRDMCLAPAIAYVRTFFNLLWDCTYFFSEDKDKWWLANAMMYRMWMGQTGSSCVSKNARIEKVWNSLAKLPLATLDTIVAYEQSFFDDSRQWENSKGFQCYKFLLALEKHRISESAEYKRLRIKEAYTSPFTGQKL